MDRATESPPVLDYLAVLRRRWRVVVAGTLAGAAAALLVNALAPRTYEAWSTLLVTDARTVERGPWRNALVPSVRAILENQSLAAQIVREFHLDAPPHELDAEEFLRDALRVEEVKGTDVIRARVRLRDAQLAARVVDRLVALALELNRRVTRDEASSQREALKSELDLARLRMQNEERALLEFKQRAQIEVSRKDVDSSLGQRGQLLGVLIDIETEGARLAKAEEELKGRERILTVRKTIDTEPVLVEAARARAGAAAGDDGRSLLGMELRTEVINPVYESLEQQITTSRTRLSALQQQKAELTDKLRMADKTVAQLTSLYQKEIELGKRELEYDLGKKIYSDVLMRYEQAPITGRKTELQVVDTALAPRRPVFPRPWLNLALGIAGGLLAGVLVAFGREYRALPPPTPSE